MHPATFVPPQGSSPRGRGIPPIPVPHVTSRRLIPAWAGNTVRTVWVCGFPGAHPRVGGEYGVVGCVPVGCGGSSPRGRGILFLIDSQSLLGGLIPAWAGNTLRCAPMTVMGTAHPRVGGEYSRWSVTISTERGSSPRGRGIRGKRLIVIERIRLIPAWAGNTAAHSWSCSGVRAHPRVGGEYDGKEGQFEGVAGSSPRGRGIRHSHGLSVSTARLIPAWAGNTPDKDPRKPRPGAHPRVGGEYIGACGGAHTGVGSSPRGRGILEGDTARFWEVGLIPAWAGNTLGDLGVYPGSVPFWYDFASSWRGAAHRGRRARC